MSFNLADALDLGHNPYKATNLDELSFANDSGQLS
jgi:hypothetical protein